MHYKQLSHRLGSRYEQYGHIQYYGCHWASEWLEADLSTFKILELGTGTGFFSELLLKRKACNLTCSDSSPSMRLFFKDKNIFKSVPYLLLNAFESLPSKWDHIYAMHLLQWAPDPTHVLTHWRQALYPGGKLLATFFIAPTLENWYRLYPSPVVWRSQIDWLTLFETAGWRLKRYSTQTQTYTFDSKFQLFKTLHATGAFSQQMTQPLTTPFQLRKDSLQKIETCWTFFRIEAYSK